MNRTNCKHFKDLRKKFSKVQHFCPHFISRGIFFSRSKNTSDQSEESVPQHKVRAFLKILSTTRDVYVPQHLLEGFFKKSEKGVTT